MSLWRSFLLALVFFFGIAIFFAPVVLAGDGWQPISQEDLKMTSEPLAPGAPAIFLYRRVDRDDKGRASTEYNYVRIKILTEEGRKYANVEIPFQKQRTSVSNIKARTIRPDGSIVSFDGKIYEQMIVKTKGAKYLAKTFVLPDVQVGSIIEYHFNYDFMDLYLFSSHWILSEELFTKRAEFTLKPYSRPPWTVQWMWPAGLPEGTKPPEEGPDHVIRMTALNIPAFQLEDYMPPPDELKFRVDFLYHDEMPEQNLDRFWKHFGKKENDRVESFVGKRKAMEQAVGQIVSPNDPPETKLQKIYARTQQVRNVSYETRKTEQEVKREKQKDINNVEDLWRNGYGSGSEITWLFLALARAAGFEAYPVLASARNEYFFNPSRMKSSELNANVVLVKLNGKDLYFDPGTAFAPYGLLPWAETGVTGLKLDKDGGSWIKTTLPGSDVSHIERSADLKLSTEGSLEGKLKITFTGLEALSRRIEERNEDDAERKKFLEDQVREYIPSAIEVELTNKPDWMSADAPLVAEFDLKVPGWVSSAGRRALLPVGLFGATEKHLFDHSNRVHPIYFAFPFKKIDRVAVELPSGWEVGSMPPAASRDAKAAEYSLKVEKIDRGFRITRELRSDLMMIPKDSYPVLRSFFQLVKTEDDQQIVLQPSAAASN